MQKQKAKDRRQNVEGKRQEVAPELLHSAFRRLLPNFCLLPSCLLPSFRSAFCLLAFCLFASAGCGPRKAAPTADGKPRIVSLSPSITEILCTIGAGDCLVGRTKYCLYPADQVKNVPVVGNFCNPSIEKLLAARPTLVLEVDSANPATDRQIAALGIPVRRITCKTLDDIPRAIREIGACANRKEAAAAIADAFTDELARLRREQPPPEQCPLVFAEIWPDPLRTAGKQSFLSELIRLAGGRNAGDALNSDYPTLSAEWLVAQNPDVILSFSMGSANASLLDAWRARSSMDTLRAVRTGRVFGGFDQDVMLKPTPRVLQAVAELRRAIRQETAEKNGDAKTPSL